MLQKYTKMQLALLSLMLLLLQLAKVFSYTGNYEAKYTKANVPLWKQRACEKAQKYKANSHYVCDDKGEVKCLPGWQGDLCQVPMCRKGCDPMNGYCQRPGECRCRIGYTGELCDKCIPLPGCQHGDCTKPFECICRPGWDGLFCTEPTCRQGCHNTRGYCETPGECRCRIGWAGRNCSDCSVLPGCQHGTCTKPLECQCLPGYIGLLCQTPICSADCHKQHGYCKKPGECRCKVGWTGPNCDKCFPYPGCVNGDCDKPWECNCKPGWGGILCDEELTYCKEHPNICENNGKCISLTKDDGSYRCVCNQGFLGKNCEIIDEFLLTSTVAPRITPPPLINFGAEENDENNAVLNKDNEMQKVSLKKEKEKYVSKLKRNGTQGEIKVTTNVPIENMTINLNGENDLENVTKFNFTKVLATMDSTKQHILLNSNEDHNVGNELVENKIIPNKTTASVYDFVPASKANETKIYTPQTKVNKTLKYSYNLTAPTTHATFLINNSSTLTPIPPLSKLEDEKNLLSLPLKQTEPSKKLQPELEAEDDDEECTDDNGDECEYVDEDEEDDDDEDDDDGF